MFLLGWFFIECFARLNLHLDIYIFISYQNLICAWKTYVVRGSVLTVDKVIITKNLKGCKNSEWHVSKKIQKTNVGFSNWSFLLFLSLFLLYSLFFIFTFDYYRAIKRQRTRINKASNISKIITMSSWRNHDKRRYWIFWKKYLMWSYLVTVYTCNIQDIV